MPQQMGLGDLGKPDMIFVREFRWILKGKYLSEMFNKTVGVDYYNRRLLVSIYEVYESATEAQGKKTHAHAWADRLESGEWNDEELVLITFDGCGNELYAKRFSGLEVKGRQNKFDYSSSEAAAHEVLLSYKSCEDVNTTKDVHPTKPKKAQIDHLNARLFIE